MTGKQSKSPLRQTKSPKQRVEGQAGWKQQRSRPTCKPPCAVASAYPSHVPCNLVILSNGNKVAEAGPGGAPAVAGEGQRVPPFPWEPCGLLVLRRLPSKRLRVGLKLYRRATRGQSVFLPAPGGQLRTG